MFRQHMMSCNCQLFSPHHYEFKEFRSPPAHTNRKALRSKRSLKSQSHSRNRLHPQEQRFLRNSEQTESQNDKNIKIIVYPSHLPSNLSSQSEYQFKITPKPIAKISLLNSKSTKDQNQAKSKENYADFCPIKSIKYQTRIQSPQSNHNTQPLKDITVNNNLRQNNCVQLVESSAPIFYNNYPKYAQSSAETTLAGSVAPDIVQNLCNRSYHNRQNLDFNPQNPAELANKNAFYEIKKQIKLNSSSNFFRVSRLSQMINEKDETESVYEGEKTHQQGGVEYSRVLISCKKLMDEKNGVLQDTHRTKLFDYYPQPSKRSNQSCTFQKINLTIPFNIR